MSFLERDDPEVAAIIENERQRQVFGLELIASENVVSRAVMEATGSIMCNKYAEGIRASGTMAGANTMMSLRILRVTGSAVSSPLSMPTSSPIRGARRTRRSILPPFSRGMSS